MDGIACCFLALGQTLPTHSTLAEYVTLHIFPLPYLLDSLHGAFTLCPLTHLPLVNNVLLSLEIASPTMVFLCRSMAEL